MLKRSEVLFFGIISGLFLAASTLPYLYASIASGEGLVFGGFLFNPIDGNTYLAKMQQGFSGAWQFVLPYTAAKSSGSFLFIYYLFLGHLARVLGSPLLWIYHLARLIGSGVLLAGLYRFTRCSLGDTPAARLAFLLAAFGSGIGAFALFALPAGKFTADFWVAEAYPFLSALAAPHFSLGFGLLLFLLAPPLERSAQPAAWRSQALRTILLSFLLAMISPFGIIVAVVGLVWPAGKAIFPFHRRSLYSILNERMPWVALGGGSWLAYYQWAAWRDPLLAGWNSQNLTPTPPLWDLALSFSPLILLALPGALQAMRRDNPGLQRVAAWFLLGMMLLYVPVGLQRRFMLGLFAPVTVLGVWFLSKIISQPRRFWLAGIALLALIIPTNLVLLLSFLGAIRTHDLRIYHTQGEAQAYAWIAEETQPDSLILAAPETGLRLPAYTGRRVIYGHPFETVNATQEEAAVIAFFTDPNAAFLAERNVDFIFYGPRERLLSGENAGELESVLTRFPIVYESQGVTLYAVTP